MSVDDLKKSWPSPIVERQQLAKFSGGLLHPKTISNLDSRGCGISGKMRCGRKVYYNVDAVLAFIKSRPKKEK